MKIIYDVPATGMPSLVRLDAIVLSESEFPNRRPEWGLAFRGDDRPPSSIFQIGFKKRLPNHRVQGMAVLVTGPQKSITREQVMGQPDRVNRTRILTYRLNANEVYFRPNYLDLEQKTCVSLSLDFQLVTGFPLTDTEKTYAYVVELPDKVLPTHNIQEDGGNSNLAKSLEVTCNMVPAANILGAAEIERTKVGNAAMCRVTYKITKWWRNVNGYPLKDTNDKLIRRIGGDIALSGEKMVSAGPKQDSAVRSNNVLKRAVSALQNHVTIEGGLVGEWPLSATVKGTELSKYPGLL